MPCSGFCESPTPESQSENFADKVSGKAQLTKVYRSLTEWFDVSISFVKLRYSTHHSSSLRGSRDCPS